MITKDFLLAGKAIFTVTNTVRGTHYTFRVNLAKPRAGQPASATPMYFVGVLISGDNENGYSYMAVLDPTALTVRSTAKSKVALDTPSGAALNYALDVISGRRVAVLPAVTVQHSGKCGKCARTLTHPESLLSGIGPECSGIGYSKASAKMAVDAAGRPKVKRTRKAKAVSTLPDLDTPMPVLATLVPCDVTVGPSAKTPRVAPLSTLDAILALTGAPAPIPNAYIAADDAALYGADAAQIQRDRMADDTDSPTFLALKQILAGR